jgi:hypothetical protein
VIFVLDAWALLAYLQGDEPAALRVKTVLHKAEAGHVTLVASLMNIGEVFYSMGGVKAKRLRKKRWLNCVSCH